MIATGKLTTYPARSRYQIVIERLELAGQGALMALLDKRRRALAAEGLFDEDAQEEAAVRAAADRRGQLADRGGDPRHPPPARGPLPDPCPGLAGAGPGRGRGREDRGGDRRVQRIARHAFNELISFIAGWAILIDYIIIIALAAVSVGALPEPDLGRLHARVGGDSASWPRDRVRGGVNIAGFTGHVRQRPLIVLALADVVLQVAVIARRGVVAFHPDLLTAHVHLFTRRPPVTS